MKPRKGRATPKAKAGPGTGFRVIRISDETYQRLVERADSLGPPGAAFRWTYDDLIRAILDQDPLVRTASACPKCRERRMDYLVWDKQGQVKCRSCGARYTPN